ncbi:STAS domain-containing protein [Jiangella asiatica]
MSTQRLGGCVIVRLAGEFADADVLPLQRALCDLVASDDVVIDLSRTGPSAATVVGALTAAHDEAVRHRMSLHVTGAAGALRRLLNRSQLEARLTYHEHLADAVESALAARDARTHGT